MKLPIPAVLSCLLSVPALLVGQHEGHGGLLLGATQYVEGRQSGARGASVVYRLVEEWPQLPPGQQFGNMTGIAVDAAGLVYAARRCPVKCSYLTPGAGDPPGSVLVFNPQGTFVREWKDVVAETHGLHIDRHGFFWATDIQKHQVRKYRTDGTLLMTLGKEGVRDGTTSDTFNQPTQVVVAGPNDDVFVSDGYGGPTVTSQRIVKFTRDGKFVKAWGKRGKGPGEFRVPHSIAADSRGRIYVADRCGRNSEPACSDGRVQIFDGDGAFVEQWTPPGTGRFSPMGVFVDKADRLYVGDSENSTIWIVDTRAGKVLERVEHPRVRNIHHLAVGTTGDIYAVSLMGGLQRYTRSR